MHHAQEARVSDDRRAAHRLLALLVIVASAGYIARVAISVIAPHLMHEFGLSQTQMGTVFSAFLVGYTAMQIPSGWLADRTRTRVIFGWATMAWLVLTAATALARPLPTMSVVIVLVALRALFGVAAAPTYPAAARAVAVSFPPTMHGRANGLVLASIGIGSALAPLVLVPVARAYGWRAGMLLASLVTALAAVAWWSLAPKATGGCAAKPDAAASAAAAPWRTSSFWFLFGSYLLQGYVGYIFVFWFYSYLVQVRHFELLQAAGITSLPWIATLIAIPAGGAASDAAVRRWGATRGRRMVPMAALVTGAAALVVGARASIDVIAVGALTLCTVLVLCTEGPFWAALNEIAGARSGAAGGVMNFGSNLGGMISPALTPWLAQHFGWEGALTATAALAAVAGLLWTGVRIGDR
jgi:ACS family glucarate transporter-like MFS transporter